MFELFVELKRYVGFSEADEATLRSLHPRLQPAFPEITEAFYARVLEHDDARAALERGEKRVGQLKVTLVKWLNELLLGPWDEAYVERRARIGRVHVEIALPQHYMVSAMNLVRVKLRERIAALGLETAQTTTAVERVCDLDLALMLHTYQEDLEAGQMRAERLATYGALVGSIGHELRNPLGVIETSLYVLKSRPHADERVTRHLDRIGQQVALANDIITQLLNLIRDAPLARTKIDLGALAEKTLSTMTGNFRLTAPAGLLVDGDETQLRQVLVNLVLNAVHFSGAAGRVEVELQRTAGGVLMIVDDTGPGIDPSIRNRLFEPLVTTRPGGNGLGLALVKRIIERHGGTIAAGRGPLGGARFTVTLPAAGANP
ncbi:MAG: protoglobin domain-containing protein [Myxococcota bacterium]